MTLEESNRSPTPRLAILMVLGALPYPPIWGSGIREFQLLRYLSSRHDVDVVTYLGEDDRANADVLRRSCRTLYGIPANVIDATQARRDQLRRMLSGSSYRATWLLSKRMQSALDDVLDRNRYDVVHLSQSTLGRFDFASGRAPLVVDEHNVEFELLYRTFRTERSPVRKLYYLSEFLKFRREEIGLWRRSAGCVVTSFRAREQLTGVVPADQVAVVPNAVDTNYFRPTEVVPEPDRLVFTGTMNYRPNIDAVAYFVRHILPAIVRARPNARLTIVGAYPTEDVRSLESPRVHVVGRVPDIRPYLAVASVVVIPLRTGSGTRLKLIEALAMAKPVVSTSLGAEGIPVRDGEHLLVADGPSAFAESVVRLLRDTALARALGQAGREYAAEHLTWDHSGSELEQFYGRILSARASRRHGDGRDGPSSPRTASTELAHSAGDA